MRIWPFAKDVVAQNPCARGLVLRTSRADGCHLAHNDMNGPAFVSLVRNERWVGSAAGLLPKPIRPRQRRLKSA